MKKVAVASAVVIAGLWWASIAYGQTPEPSDGLKAALHPIEDIRPE